MYKGEKGKTQRIWTWGGAPSSNPLSFSFVHHQLSSYAGVKRPTGHKSDAHFGSETVDLSPIEAVGTQSKANGPEENPTCTLLTKEGSEGTIMRKLHNPDSLGRYG